MELAIFLILSMIGIASALNILIQRHPIYSALSLILTFLSLAGIYIQMQAEFIAVMQVVIYTGAIMVLFVFVIMLLNVKAEERVPNKLIGMRYVGIPLSLLLVTALGLNIFQSFSGQTLRVSDVSTSGLTGNTQSIGKLLYTQYTLPFEVTSILLLVGIVGAIIMAKKEL
ncbi:MAG: NADH-quinone oxidoreductase subunit J [Acidobacteria bacterium]|nr:MAG: NADH-quinone oxidoreductase subunit J [Acidobacteriota bacterium]